MKLKILKIAKRLSELFNSGWQSFSVSSPKGFDLIELLLLKEGMNSLGTSAIINFYKNIKEYFGNSITYITGDNGDKLIFTVDQPLKKFSKLEELIYFTIKDRAVLPIKFLQRFIPFDENELFETLVNLFSSYPENDLTQKFIHFRVLEKPFKYAFQGEDRHRNYFWNASPFWSYPFYDYLMNCPDEMKKSHRTFRNWLESYSQEATDLKYTNFRSSITSLQGKIFMSIIYNLYPKVPANFKRQLKTLFFHGNPVIEVESPLIRTLQELKNKKTITDYIQIPDKLVLTKQRKNILFSIITLASAIEFLNGEELSLTKFQNEYFD